MLTAQWWKEDRGEVCSSLQPERPAQDGVGACCVRARPGAQVSTPVRWEELDVTTPTS